MTTERIKISQDTAGRIAVSGRELHEFLGIESEYMHWFRRMSEYGFLENQDFEVIVKKDENPQGGRPATDHAISIDMAKEISMIQRTEKGKEARLYFIACERQLKESKPTGLALVQEAMQFLIAENSAKDKVIEHQQAKIAADASKVDFAEKVSECKEGLGFREFGLKFRQNGAGFGQNGLIERLLNDKYIYRDQKGNLRPYAEYTHEEGLFWTQTVIIDSEKGKFEKEHVKITGKGQKHFIDKYMPLLPEAGGAVTVADELGNDVEVELATAPRTTGRIPDHHYNDDETVEY